MGDSGGTEPYEGQMVAGGLGGHCQRWDTVGYIVGEGGGGEREGKREIAG
jgi:hypothetical protein